MNKKIVIIGAGASGIAAATKLFSNGFRNLIVLEAEPRIGGRIHTIPFGKNVLDMGAQWCHGERDNVVFGLANQHDDLLQTNTVSYKSLNMIQSNGKKVPQEVSNDLMGLAKRILIEYEDEMKLCQGSLGSFIMEKYNEAIRLPEFRHVDGALAQQFIEFFHKYENSFEASDTWFQASCNGYTDYWDCEGELLLNWRDKGYTTVFDLLMNKIPNPSHSLPIEERIQFNKVVRSINWNAQPFATVECEDGSRIDADHIICTVSLGVLKERYLSMFRPELPQSKCNAIEGLTLGTVDKIYLEFDSPFWPEDWSGFSMLWTQADQEALREREEDRWVEDVFGFFRVNYQPNVLCGWISGASARRMEMLTDGEVYNAVVKLLRRFLKSMNVKDPIRVKRSQWYTNPNFRGSYTFRSTKADVLKTSPSELAAPLTNSSGLPVLQFAGEATHDHYYSTVHGAVETGWREAQRLIDLYKTKSRL